MDLLLPLIGIFAIAAPLIILRFYKRTAKTTESTQLIDGVLFSEEGKTLLECPKDKKGKYTIPQEVTTIGEKAFAFCADLTEIAIPPSVKTIGDWAFYECAGLTEVDIPASVKTIGDWAFAGCRRLTEITVVPENVAYTSTNGVLFLKDMKTLICYPAGKSGAYYTIPSCVAAIGNGAFWACGSMTTITIPNSVAVIGNRAFLSCARLTEVIIPESVTTIGSEAFVNCQCITAIKVAHKNAYYKSSKGILFSKDQTTLICYPKGNSRTCYRIPSSVTTIEAKAFFDCGALTTVTFQDSVTAIGERAFAFCEGLTAITIPDSVTSIGESAFEDCCRLTITLPDRVLAMGKGALSGCKDIIRRDITKRTIYSGVDEMPALYDFRDGKTKKREVLSARVGKRKESFHLEQIEIKIISFLLVVLFFVLVYIIQRNASSYRTLPVVNSATFSEDGTTLIDFRGVTGEYIIPYGVTTIGERAFEKCISLTSIIIPDSVTTIGDWAFSGCHSLTSITIPESVTTIGARAFLDCQSLTSIILPNGLTTIGEWTFSDCHSLTSITIPYSVTTLGEGAFSDCHSLTSINIPDSVTTIGNWAFSECKDLTIIAPEGSEAHEYAIRETIRFIPLPQ